MSASNPSTDSITAFRDRIRLILECEANTSSSRHIVILAIDGIPYELARGCWRYAKTQKMRSVFPTTSSTAWLSSLSGMSVDSHGVPGVMFKVPDSNGALINVYDYKGDLCSLEIENIFSDAIGFGYTPLSILGDLEDYDCSWRDLLLRHSRRVRGHKFYRSGSDRYVQLDPMVLCRDIRNAILDSLDLYSQGSSCLLWCFVETDRHVHYFGYDERVIRFLELIEQTAIELLEKDAIVIAHSDHGLTPTSHESQIEQLVERLKISYECSVGGAGRTRWIYAKPGTDEALINELGRDLPTSIRISNADDLFLKGSLSRSRVGKIMLIAQEQEFLTPPGYSFDHGSFTDNEADVPFSEWRS